jgi:hypothetical protein
MPSIPCLHLLIPDLLEPPPDDVNCSALRRLPSLEVLLARADIEPFAEPNLLATLFSLFGYANAPDTDWPSAALCRQAQGRAPDGDYWLHADPVHLQPDMDRVLLTDARTLDIQPEEAAALTQQIEGHFADLGWRLEAPTPDCWHLGLKEAPAITTTPLATVMGRPIYPFLPNGPAARQWRALSNEVQMLLFHAPENQRRRAQGRPEINGIWLWGGGRLPPSTTSRWQTVWSEALLVRGLAGDITKPWPHKLTAAALSSGEQLGLCDELALPLADGDGAAWERAIFTLEDRCTTLLKALHNRTLHALWIYPCNGQRFYITQRGLWRIWRRPRSWFMHR